MSVREINPEETTRASAYKLWMKAPNPMVTFFKTFDVMPIIDKSRMTGMKFNMLLDHCIGKAARYPTALKCRQLYGFAEIQQSAITIRWIQALRQAGDRCSANMLTRAGK